MVFLYFEISVTFYALFFCLVVLALFISIHFHSFIHAHCTLCREGESVRGGGGGCRVQRVGKIIKRRKHFFYKYLWQRRREQEHIF